MKETKLEKKGDLIGRDIGKNIGKRKDYHPRKIDGIGIGGKT